MTLLLSVNLPSLCQHWGFASLPALGFHRHAATLVCLAKGCELFPWCSDTWSSLYELLSRVILIYYTYQWASFKMPDSTVDCLSPFDLEWFLNEKWCSRVPLWDPWVVSTYERRNRYKICYDWRAGICIGGSQTHGKRFFLPPNTCQLDKTGKEWWGCLWCSDLELRLARKLPLAIQDVPYPCCSTCTDVAAA